MMKANTSISTTILIIDDDPVAQMLSKRNLEIAGFRNEIISAEDGEIGLEILANFPNVQFTIILDYHMPVLDGVGFLNRMKNANLNFPVYMLSSSIMKSHKEECMRMENVVEYLVKPIDQEKSKRIIETTRALLTS